MQPGPRRLQRASKPARKGWNAYLEVRSRARRRMQYRATISSPLGDVPRTGKNFHDPCQGKMRAAGCARSSASPPAPHKLRDHTNRPEVVRQIGIGDVSIGHHEVALDSPARSPRVSDDEAVLTVVIADCHHRVTAERMLSGRWHRHDSGFRHFWTLEALIYGEAKYERIAVRKAALELRQGLNQPAVLHDFVLRRQV